MAATRRKGKLKLIQVNSTTTGRVGGILDTRGFEPLTNYGSFGRNQFGKGQYGNSRAGFYVDPNTKRVAS